MLGARMAAAGTCAADLAAWRGIIDFARSSCGPDSVKNRRTHGPLVYVPVRSGRAQLRVHPAAAAARSPP